MKEFTFSVQVENSIVEDTQRDIIAQSKSEAVKKYKEQMDEEFPGRFYWATFPKSDGGIDKVYLWS